MACLGIRSRSDLYWGRVTHLGRRLTGNRPLVAWVLMLVATWTFFHWVPAWTPSSDDLVVNGRFDRGLEAWSAGPGVQARTSVEGLVLESRRSRPHAGIEQAFAYPSPCDHLRLLTVLAVEEVVAGDHPWQRARLVVGRRAGGGWALETSPLLTFEGTLPWSQHEAVLPCPRPVERIYLRVELHDVTGIVRLSRIHLTPVHESTWVTTARVIGIIAWAVLGMILVRRLVVRVRALGLTLPMLALAALIVVGVMIPEALRNELVDGLGLPRSPIAVGPFTVPGSTLGHGLLFAALAALLGASGKAPARLRLLGWLVLFAVTTEILQNFVPGRAPDPTDLWADICGIALGLLGGGLIRRQAHKR